MPALRDKCHDNNKYCCICEQNECFVALPGEVALFADGEEVITTGNRCDCIVVIKKVENTKDETKYQLEIYAVELKSIQKIKDKSDKDKSEALHPDSLRQKCQSCLNWAEKIQFNTAMQKLKRTTIEKYCIIAVPTNVLDEVKTLMKRRLPGLKPENAKEFRIIACNEPITQRPLLQF